MLRKYIYLCYIKVIMEQDLISVIKGNIRKRVILNLIIPNTPTQLAKKINAYRASVSRSLLFLKKKGLVECINENDTLGRLYKLTDKGKEVYDILKKM